MYILATTTKYKPNTKYYTESSGTYTLLVEGTDYVVGTTITGTIYEQTEYDKLYIRPWGSSSHFEEFPYSVDGINNSLPEHDAGQNDVDLDAYTNTEGKTVRGRVRHDVKTLDFNIPIMDGAELKKLLEIRSPEWFECIFFDEAEWGFISKKLYCSSPKYHKYYIDKVNPLYNQYTDIQFGFVEE